MMTVETRVHVALQLKKLFFLSLDRQDQKTMTLVSKKMTVGSSRQFTNSITRGWLSAGSTIESTSRIDFCTKKSSPRRPRCRLEKSTGSSKISLEKGLVAWSLSPISLSSSYRKCKGALTLLILQSLHCLLVQSAIRQQTQHLFH